jgi:hypothetical protein
MSLILVNDVTNSKLRELKCNASGELSVEKVDNSLLATEASLSGLNAKVVACDTGSISGTVAVSAVAGDVSCTHASLPLPTGAASETTLSALNGKVVACDTGSISGTVAVSAVAGNVSCTHASLPLPSGAATETSLSGLNAKVVACDTGSISGTVAVSAVAGNVSCTHASLPLPSGAATETTLSALNGKVVACDTGSLALDTTLVTSNSHLSTLAGAVSAGVMQVSAGSVSASSSQVFGTGGSTATVADSTTSKSSAFDADAFKCITIFGNSTNTSDSEIQVEVSPDNSNWFELNNLYVNLDYLSGDYGVNFECGARYIRLSRSNTSGSSDSIKAWISGK